MPNAMMRFGLRDLLAVVTLFALLLAGGLANNAIRSDGVWTVEVVESVEADWLCDIYVEEGDMGASPVVYEYFARLRNGSRIRWVSFGDNMTFPSAAIPEVGDRFVFNLNGRERFFDSAVHCCLPGILGQPSLRLNRRQAYAITDLQPARSTDVYPPALNIPVTLFFSVFLLSVFRLMYHISQTLSTQMSAWIQERSRKREAYRKTHIV